MSSICKRGLALLTLLVLAGQGCTKALPAETVKASQRIELNMWAVNDDVDAYNAVLADFRALHPNVTVNYRRLRLEEYETALVEALAIDRGPDIFLIHNDWTGKYIPKITPMPASVKMAYSVVTGTIKKEQTWELRTEPSITRKTYKEQFVDVVIQDTVRLVNISAIEGTPDFQERIMGLPVSVDTMALFYNKDLLNVAGIPTPPETWDAFQAQVKKLVKLDAKGEILQAGAGIGTAENVERSTDLLSILMTQNGVQMAADDGSPTFQLTPVALQDRPEPPSHQALQFYTDFANPDKDTYTWNESQPNSLDAFIQGKSAFFFGYSYQLPQIRARAPKLNLGITKLPQIKDNPVKNEANYWYWVVSKKSKNQDAAWSLLNFLIQPEETKKILAVTKHPAARKSLLTEQLEDEDVGVFASQVLTAVSWYKGNDPAAVEEAFNTMITDVVNGRILIRDAIKFAVEKISQTIR